MQIDVNKVLIDLHGNALKAFPGLTDVEGKPVESPPMTVAHVLITAALQVNGSERKLKYYNHIRRYQLALNIEAAMKQDPPHINISRTVAEEIRPELELHFGPLIAGQILLMLGY